MLVDFFLLLYRVLVLLYLLQLQYLFDHFLLLHLRFLHQQLLALFLPDSVVAAPFLNRPRPLQLCFCLIGVQEGVPPLAKLLDIVAVLVPAGEDFLRLYLALEHSVPLLELLEILVSDLLPVDVEVEVLELAIDLLVAESLLGEEVVLVRVVEFVVGDVGLQLFVRVYSEGNEPELALELLEPADFVLELPHLRRVALVEVEAVLCAPAELPLLAVLRAHIQALLYAVYILPLVLLDLLQVYFQRHLPVFQQNLLLQTLAQLLSFELVVVLDELGQPQYYKVYD